MIFVFSFLYIYCFLPAVIFLTDQSIDRLIKVVICVIKTSSVVLWAYQCQAGGGGGGGGGWGAGREFV